MTALYLQVGCGTVRRYSGTVHCDLAQCNVGTAVHCSWQSFKRKEQNQQAAAPLLPLRRGWVQRGVLPRPAHLSKSGSVSVSRSSTPSVMYLMSVSLLVQSSNRMA